MASRVTFCFQFIGTISHSHHVYSRIILNGGKQITYIKITTKVSGSEEQQNKTIHELSYELDYETPGKNR